MGNRMALGITTILTIMFLLGSLNGFMPRVSYPKALDWYLLVSFSFAFLSLAECMVVFVVWLSENKGKKMKVWIDLFYRQFHHCTRIFKYNYPAVSHPSWFKDDQKAMKRDHSVMLSPENKEIKLGRSSYYLIFSPLVSLWSYIGPLLLTFFFNVNSGIVCTLFK